MLNCREVTELASAALERPLTLRERLEGWMHMSMCSGCRNFQKQVVSLRKISHAYVSAPDKVSGHENIDGQ